ncbi:LysR family transcriptional regulator [Roseomonas xinghualingensis]|uniref:LysR family transcriptional regulator n=1 Tax=Roseomonas xinghualingensis TaxID=2986475 RepID=UPI0021F1C748|nr:LysR family transcriptional regulator [Roseomonas sp. SXEYE001]MCV4209412.1 LysR family transcriptional regulator [Roseomonas sp. SXEYE001]
MSSRRFRYFVAVAQELHVGRAAERLGIAQPALTQQIRVLEAELGVRLVRRAGRGIVLTEAGTALLPEALGVLEQEERATAVARRAARGEIGTLNIGYVSTAMLEPELPALLSAFRQMVPDAAIHLEETAVQDQLVALEQQRLDVGIVREPTGPLPASLRMLPFLRGRLLAAVPAELAGRLQEPVRLRDLADCTFVTLRDPHGLGLGHSVWSLCVQAGFSPRISLQVNNVVSVLGLVAAGFGVSLVPAALRRVEMPGMVLLEVEGEGACTGLAILHRSTDRSSLKQRFLELTLSGRMRRKPGSNASGLRTIIGGS